MFHGAQLDYLSTFNSIRKGSVFESVFMRSFLVENPFGPCHTSSHLQQNILTIFLYDAENWKGQAFFFSVLEI